MATTLTRNLKLKINSNLTAEAKYNLERIDLLGSAFLVDTTNTLNLRSQTNILIEPESADLDGSGVGGTVSIGTASHDIDTLAVYATNFTLSTNLGLKDQATSGTKQLLLRYKSDINGSVDTTADRTLSVDLNGADRNLVLGGTLSLLGGDLTWNLSGTTSLTLPQTGTLSTLAGAEVLTGKTIDANSNTISNLTNSSISSSAAIVYSKLALAGGIVNADISGSAAIAYSKLVLSSSITNSDISSSAAVDYSKLALSNSITNGDISGSAAVAYSKLNLSGSVTDSDISSSASIARSKIALGIAGQLVVNDGSGALSSTAILNASMGGTGVSGSATYPTSGTVLTDSSTDTVTNKSISGSSNTLSNIAYGSLALTNSVTNADIAAAAGISYSKLALTGSLVNADISASAAIAGTKISPDFGNQLIRTLVGLEFEEGGYTTTLQAAQGGQSGDLVLSLPPDYGTNGQVLQTNGSGDTSWITVSGTGTVTSVDLSVPAEFTVSGNPITTAGTITVTKATQTANKVYAGPTSGGAAQPAFRSLVVADMPASAVVQASTTWAPSDGATKSFVHGLGTLLIDVSLIDDSGDIVYCNINLVDSNTIQLVSSETPGGNWTVVVQGR